MTIGTIFSNPKQSPKKSPQRGVTLIELMVASVILGIGITGVMSMIGIGRDLDFQNKLRREATIAATRILEDSAFNSAKYREWDPVSPSTVPPTVPSRTLVFEPGIYAINAIANIKVSQGLTTVWAGIPSPSRLVEVKILWPNSYPTDSLYLAKRIAEVK